MKKLFTALFLLAAFATAQAQTSLNLGVASDYRFRGISQTQNGPAVQGGIDVAHKSGLYVGNWNSNVSKDVYTGGAGTESDFYAGFKKDIAGFSVDVGALQYYYLGATGSNTNELYGSVGRGPLTVKYSQSLGNYFGIANSKGSSYLQADLNVPLSKTLTANAHIGRTSVANHGSVDYTDIKVGATQDFKGFAVGVHYYTNTAGGTGFAAANTVAGHNLHKNAVVASVSKSF